MLPAFDLRFSSTGKEACGLLDEDWYVIAGGTEMVPALRIGALSPIGLVDINSNAEMRTVAKDGPNLEIGALVTHSEVTNSDLVIQHVPVMSRICMHVGNARVRSTGTVGGNLCFAEPRSDLSTVLHALGASIVLISPESERVLSIPEFLVGAFQTSIENREVLQKVKIPLPAEDVNYWKFTFGERPTVGLAWILRDAEIHVVVGAATEVPTSHTFVKGEKVDMESWAEELEIESDLAGSAEYKRRLIVQKLREIGVGSL
jgi:carbon-monoxide dehydrogenase medium subunit